MTAPLRQKGTKVSVSFDLTLGRMQKRQKSAHPAYYLALY
jgi:hypothetical protein